MQAKALLRANLVKRIQYYIAVDCQSVHGVFDFGRYKYPFQFDSLFRQATIGQ